MKSFRSGAWLAHDRDALVKAAGALVAIYPWSDAVYLFGSRARSHERAESDVDLAVLPDAISSPVNRVTAEADLSRFLEERLKVPVNVGRIRRALSPALLFDIFSVQTIL